LGFTFSYDPTRRDFQFLSALGGSPHLLRQMPFRIGDYSGTTSSPADWDFAKLNLLICSKLENRSI